MPRVIPKSRKHSSKALSDEQVKDYFGDEDFDDTFEDDYALLDFDDYDTHQNKGDDWNEYAIDRDGKRNKVRHKRKTNKRSSGEYDELDFE